LLELPNLTVEERRELRRLRNAALRRALRSQAGRVVHGRWSADLPAYLLHRARTHGDAHVTAEAEAASSPER
jgi:hypothetical protein